MSKEIIELTEEEKTLEGYSITLKEVADKFELQHKNLKRDLLEMLGTLTEENLDRLKYERIFYIDSMNRQQETYKLDMKTMLWFVTKFNHNLRAQIVDYAISQLEEERKEANVELKLAYQKYKRLEEKLMVVKKEVIATNTSTTNRYKRSKYLEDLKDSGIIDWTEKLVTHKTFTVTEKGKALGYYIENNVVKLNVGDTNE